MSESDIDGSLQALVQHIFPNGVLRRWWPLVGGVSAQVIGLELACPAGHVRRLVVRRHGSADLRRNPRIALDEFALLTLLQREQIKAPVPVFADGEGQYLGTPCIVLEHIEGASQFEPLDLSDFLRQAAEALVSIHRVDMTDGALSFLPVQMQIDMDDPYTTGDAVKSPSLVAACRDVLQEAVPIVSGHGSCLLHGDFWPGNLLWHEGRLVAVIDWEDAALGDPLADLTNARLEMLWAFGAVAMNAFTQHYRVLNHSLNFARLPYWDLYAAWRTASKFEGRVEDPVVLETMRARHEKFIQLALARLGRLR